MTEINNSNAERIVWGIHTTNDLLFLNTSVIAIGWERMGNLALLPATKVGFVSQYSKAYPDAKKRSVSVGVGMLFRFYNEIKIGDYVVYPSKIDRMINIGQVTGNYFFDEKDDVCLVHRRTVKWLKRVPRIEFSQGALYEIGALMTLFQVRNFADEFLSVLDGKRNRPVSSEVDDTVEATAESIIENTQDFVLKELSRLYKGYDLEPVVANLLRTMGYRTVVSRHGGDGGIDIKAYKGELPPRIIVQVKSQDSDISETALHALKGTMKEGDYGLFVTLSNYTKNALKFLENTPIIRGIKGTELVDLILEHYDDLDEEFKKRIPLKRVYIPVRPDTECQKECPDAS